MSLQIIWFKYANLDGAKESNLKLPYAVIALITEFEGKQPPPPVAVKIIILAMAMLK